MLQLEAVLLLQADSFFFLFKQILVTQLSPGLLSSPKLKHLEYYGLKTLPLLLKKIKFLKYDLIYLLSVLHISLNSSVADPCQSRMLPEVELRHPRKSESRCSHLSRSNAF